MWPKILFCISRALIIIMGTFSEKGIPEDYDASVEVQHTILKNFLYFLYNFTFQ
jgi:hypothetical protein